MSRLLLLLISGALSARDRLGAVAVTSKHPHETNRITSRVLKKGVGE
jgi:hypothetical protein